MKARVSHRCQNGQGLAAGNAVLHRVHQVKSRRSVFCKHKQLLSLICFRLDTLAAAL